MLLSLPFTMVNAGQNIGDMRLAKRCHQVYIKLKEARAVETNEFCSDKILESETDSDLAGQLIIDDNYSSAKHLLNMAISSLKYSTLEDCSQAVSIMNNRLELEDILSQIK